MNVEISTISQRYRKGALALDNLSFTIGPGMFGLLGPNGAGKTTLMRIMATLLIPSAGDVYIGDYSVRRQPRAVRRLLGYLPQQFIPYSELTVEEFLDYIAILSGLGRQRRAIVDELLARVNLEAQRRVHTNKLSGGMQRRLGIAQALVSDPQLLIVDEPTAGLDPEERVRFRNLLASLSEERIILLSTHIVEDIASTCADLAVLGNGQLRFRGAPADLAKIADGQVWVMPVGRTQLEHLHANTTVVQTVRNQDGWHVRLLADAQPGPHARSVAPKIEDGYLALMRKEGTLWV